MEKEFIMAGSCIYRGREYSNGAVVCQNGIEFRCVDGTWEDLGTTCSNSGDGEFLRGDGKDVEAGSPRDDS